MLLLPFVFDIFIHRSCIFFLLFLVQLLRSSEVPDAITCTTEIIIMIIVRCIIPSVFSVNDSSFVFHLLYSLLFLPSLLSLFKYIMNVHESAKSERMSEEPIRTLCSFCLISEMEQNCNLSMLICPFKQLCLHNWKKTNIFNERRFY